MDYKSVSESITKRPRLYNLIMSINNENISLEFNQEKEEHSDVIYLHIKRDNYELTRAIHTETWCDNDKIAYEFVMSCALDLYRFMFSEKSKGDNL